jgi:hypothetical protein
MEEKYPLPMQWPEDILDKIWDCVRKSIHPGLKRRQCGTFRGELLEKWVRVVFESFVENRTGTLMNLHPEGNFMDSDEFVRFPLVLSLISHWNIDNEVLQYIDDDHFHSGNAIVWLFREDWKSTLLEAEEDAWPNCIRDMEYAMS